jgi:hypothetical protein
MSSTKEAKLASFIIFKIGEATKITCNKPLVDETYDIRFIFQDTIKKSEYRRIELCILEAIAHKTLRKIYSPIALLESVTTVTGWNVHNGIDEIKDA